MKTIKKWKANLKQEDHPITFANLPEAVGRVLNILGDIELLLCDVNPEITLRPPVSTKELCKFLNITEPTLTRHRRNGTIPYLTIGSAIRYDLSKVVAALENKKGGRK